MSELSVWNDFSAGWIPSDSHLNSRKNGCPRMDNLVLDENGVLTLTGGTSVIAEYSPRVPASIYSKVVAGNKYRYLVMTDGNIFRNAVNIGTSTPSISLAAFGAAFGFVYIYANDLRLIDNGTTTYFAFANAPLTAPGVVGVDPELVEVTGDYDDYVIINSEGTYVSSSPTQYNVDTSATTFRATIESVFTSPINSLSLSGGSKGGPDDIFKLPFQCEEPSQLVSVTVQFLLAEPATPGEQVDDYFTYTWNNAAPGGNQFNQSYNSWSTLQAARKDFARHGSVGSYDWNAIQCVRFTAVCVSEISLAFYDAYFFGGSAGPLNGTYEYMQVNVARRDGYETRSVASPVSTSLTLKSTAVSITPIDPNVGLGTEWEIYRRGGLLGTTFALVKSGTGVTPFVDDLSDILALNPLNLTYDPNLRSIAPLVTPDAILAMVGPIAERMIYFTFKEIIFSDQNSTGTYNIQQVRGFSGDLGEIFLWATQVGRSTVLVGTSKDIYVMEGTFNTLPDGYIDVFVSPLGVSAPPISYDVTRYNGAAVYMTANGWSMTEPSGATTYLSGLDTDALFKGKTRYDYDPTVIHTFGDIRYSCAVAQNTLYAVNPTDLIGARYVQAYDFVRKYWRPVFLNPSLLFGEEDGNLIGFWGDDSKLRNINISTSKLLDGTTKQEVKLLSPIFTAGTLRNRKDTYTAKLNVYTGGDNLTFTWTGESGNTVVETINTSFLEPVYVDLGANVELWWYFEITGDCPDFILADISVDYDVRPAMLTHLRIPATNYGSMARKRLPAMPFKIDTLGTDINFRCIRDGVPEDVLAVNSNYPQTFEYLFNTDTTGIDFEWLIYVGEDGAIFEWFGFSEPKHLQVLPELVEFIRSPETNFGSNAPKEISAWPVTLACLGSTVTLTIYADGAAVGALECDGTEKQTYTLYFNPPISGVDFYYTLASEDVFEEYDNGINSDLVKFSYVFKKPATFTQIGPIQIFRYGKIKAFEFRMRATGTEATVTFYFDNKAGVPFTITTTPDKDLAYVVSVPKTLAGEILTVTFSTDIFPHYFEICRILHTVSGAGTDERWSPWNGN